MKIFGPVKSIRSTNEIEVVDTPVGQTCARCREDIAAEDPGYLVPHLDENGESERPYHRECFLRGVFGSVAHQKGECYCFGGDGEDDPDLTVREAAKAAEHYYLLHPPKETT